MALYPLIFQPIFKERVWGGRKLEQLYLKALPPGVPVGESWEISDRPGDVSIIANGAFVGRDLHWLLERYGQELAGEAALCQGRFPLLVKILDAQEKLSLQVHPPPAKAAMLGGEPKTELWYIAQAVPNAELYVGLRRGCTRAEFAERIKVGTVEGCFHRLPVRAGEAMFLPSGRVHAVGAGLVIFEIQQNSDTTYRVFDWNRVGLDGKPRDLHVKQSLESIDFDDLEPELIRPGPLVSPTGSAVLVSDPLFTVELVKLAPATNLPLQSGRMHILATVSGALCVQSAKEQLSLGSGQFCLIPASLKGVAVRAVDAAAFLRVQPGTAGETRL